MDVKEKTAETSLITTTDIKEVFTAIRPGYETFIKRQFHQGLMTRQYAIDRQQVLVMAERILLQMVESGVGESEVMEWLLNKEEIRTMAVRDIITKS